MIKPTLNRLYKWKHQHEILAYLGYSFSGNGYWHQFARIEKPAVVWCEVLPSQLESFEDVEFLPTEVSRLACRDDLGWMLAEPQLERLRIQGRAAGNQYSIHEDNVSRWRDNPGSIIDSDGTVWDTGAEHY